MWLLYLLHFVIFQFFVQEMLTRWDLASIFLAFGDDGA